MKISTLLLSLFTFLVYCSPLFAQTYNMSNSTVNTCSGTFYDSGGAGGNYGSDENRTMTFCAPAGQSLTISFTMFNLNSGENFYIYDGPNTGSPLIGNFPATSPGQVTSAIGGCLTFRFTSDDAGFLGLFPTVGPGWAATISCSSCSDGVQNGNEIDIDCGGNCAPCSDCNNGIQDGNETGIDCGPTCPFACPIPCNVDLTYTTPTYNPPPVGGPAYNMPNNSINNVINTCGGTFYDPGGTGNYGNNNLGTQTFCSDMPGGQLQFIFTQWALENCCDYLTIYDGPNTSGTQLFYGHGSTNPGTITSTTGCLTFVWDSDGSVVGAGWTATINCVNVPQPLDCNGGNIVLTAVGQGEYNLVMDNDFDAGDAGTGWNTNITADFTNPCDPSVDGGTYMWMGNSAPHPRIIETVPMDVSCGGEICFYLDFSTQGGASPCEGPDLAGEGVYFEYSTNGGATWVQIDYFHPNGGYDPIMTAWNQYCYTIPPGAMTPNTLFHWAQTGSSGIGNDHWGIDNVTISSLVDCNPYVYNYWHVPGGDDNPVQNTNITQTTTYTVTYTNGADSCTTSITIPVPPGTTADAGPDQTICIGDPAVLIGAAPVTTDDGATYSWTSGAGSGTINFGGSVNGQVSVSPAVTTTYTLTVTYNGCSMTDDVTITVDNCGCTVTADNSGPICSGPGLTIDLTASNIPGATYSWTGPSGFVSNAQNPTNVPVPSAAGTYDYTVEANDNGALCTAMTTVTVHPLPIANAGGNQTLTCTTTSVPLDGATGSTLGMNYSWTGPGIVSGGNTATPTVNQVGTYTLTVTNPATNCVSTSTVNVNQNITPPNANAGANDELTCTTVSVQLDGAASDAGMDYSWTGPGITADGNTTTPTVNQVGTYTLTVTNPANGCESTSTVDVTENVTPPVANAGANDELTCVITSVELDGSVSDMGMSYSWAGPGITANGTTTTPTVNQAGTYTLTVTNPANGCESTSTVDVTENVVPPVADAGLDAVISCATNSVQLDGSGSDIGMDYSWAGPGITANGNATNPTVNQAGLYTITVTNPANGCESTDNVNVTNDLATPIANAGPNQLLTCVVNSLQLDGSGSSPGMVYAWTGPGITADGNTTTPTVNQIGTYTITVTDTTNGCVNTANVSVTEDITTPNADAGSGVELTCVITTVQLDGFGSSPNMDYSWTGPGIVSGATSQNPVVDEVGTYILTVTNPANGCENTSSVNVTEDVAAPLADAGGNDELTCAITSVQLDGSDSDIGMNYSWAGPGITADGNTTSPTVNQIGTYTLTVTNPLNGCVSTSTVDVTENVAPPVADAGPDQELSCAVTSVQLDGTNSDDLMNYSWTGPGITAGGNSETPTVNQIGTYTLTVTNPANSCVSTSTVNVTNDIGVPNANAGPDGELTCIQTTVELDGTGSSTSMDYSWAGPGIVADGNTTTPTVNQPGTYTLTVTNTTNGCVNTSTVDVTIDNTIPDISINPAQTINCNFPSITLEGNSATAGANYSWAGPGIVAGGNTLNPTVDQSGLYTLTVINPVNGCENTAQINVNDDLTIPDVNFIADTVMGCAQLSVNFQEVSGQAGMNYQWSFGDGNNSNGGPSVSNFYNQLGCFDVSLTVTNPVNGCSDSSSSPSLICIIPSPNAAFTASPMSVSSEFGLVTFTNGSTNATTHEWDFGDGSPTSGVINPTHDYTNQIGNHMVQLVVSNQGLCYDTAWITITVIEEELFYVPNSFTPDGDSYNELFRPVFTQGFDPYNFTMYIFNRWGEIVWQSHNYDVGWDGTYGGRIVEDGTYTWKIEVKTNKNDERRMYTGHVNIIR